tara:strand:- start:1337 stop:2266 length:930 start_codon:yes stop_codon:yes gene_type:complete
MRKIILIALAAILLLIIAGCSSEVEDSDTDDLDYEDSGEEEVEEESSDELTGLASGETEATPISECTDFEVESGRKVYKLTQDISGLEKKEICMNFTNRKNVVLDCAGHTISGSNAGLGNGGLGTAILVSHSEDITVRNCVFTNLNIAVDVDRSSSSVIDGNNFTDVVAAIEVHNVANTNKIINNFIDGATTGIRVGDSFNDINSKGNIVQGNTIKNTLSVAIEVFRGSSNTEISSNIVRDNKENGIKLGPNTKDTLIKDNEACSNGPLSRSFYDFTCGRNTGITGTGNVWDTTNIWLGCEHTLKSSLC